MTSPFAPTSSFSSVSNVKNNNVALERLQKEVAELRCKVATTTLDDKFAYVSYNTTLNSGTAVQNVPGNTSDPLSIFLLESNSSLLSPIDSNTKDFTFDPTTGDITYTGDNSITVNVTANMYVGSTISTELFIYQNGSKAFATKHGNTAIIGVIGRLVLNKNDIISVLINSPGTSSPNNSMGIFSYQVQIMGYELTNR